jgi:hypothetical protein
MFAPIFGPFKLDVMEIEIKCVKYGIKMFWKTLNYKPKILKTRIVFTKWVQSH